MEFDGNDVVPSEDHSLRTSMNNLRLSDDFHLVSLREKIFVKHNKLIGQLGIQNVVPLMKTLVN